MRCERPQLDSGLKSSPQPLSKRGHRHRDKRKERETKKKEKEKGEQSQGRRDGQEEGVAFKGEDVYGMAKPKWQELRSYTIVCSHGWYRRCEVVLLNCPLLAMLCKL